MHPRRGGRSYTDRRYVIPCIFQAVHNTDSDAPPFPPRIARRRDHKTSSPEHGTSSGLINPAQPPELTFEIITAVDRHLAEIGLYQQPMVRAPRNDVNTAQVELPLDVPVAPHYDVRAPPPSMPPPSAVPTLAPVIISPVSAPTPTPTLTGHSAASKRVIPVPPLLLPGFVGPHHSPSSFDYARPHIE